MVSEGKGRIFKRADSKYLVYLPLDLATDSQFPFQLGEENSVRVKVSFEVGRKRLLIEDLSE